MDSLIDGRGVVNVRIAAKIINRSSSIAVFLQNWRSIAVNLGISDAKILDLQLKINVGTLQIGDLPHELLLIWRAEEGSSASLERLREALVDCGVTDIAESLRASKICSENGTTEFMFSLQGKMFTLNELLGENASDSYHEICNEIKKNRLEHSSQLMKDQLTPPTQPKYYVPRTLLYRPSTELDSGIFRSDSAQNEVFLFRGLDRSELARLTGYQFSIDLSRNQLHNVTARFIILETETDFGRICKMTSKPVHVVEQNTGCYFWVKSNKNLEVIRKFLLKPGEFISEQEMALKIISTDAPLAWSIADSPGMGKTLVLSSLATRIRQQNPSNCTHLFIVLQEFAQKLEKVPVDSKKCAIKAIAGYLSCNSVAELVLQEMLSREAHQFYLFLDGYDEVIQENVRLVDKLLEYMKELRNVHMIVTTRPHIQTHLEDIFNEFAYQIVPFNESNQIEFLTSYWVEQHKARKCEQLVEFVRHCLSALETNLTDKDKEIAGIPLQCMILGEVYAEDAERASNLEIVPEEIIIKPFSLFDMYKKLVEIKLSRVKDEHLRRNYLHAHVFYASEILFPIWYRRYHLTPYLIRKLSLFYCVNRENLRPALCQYDDNEIDAATIYSIGFIANDSNDVPRFIHRTFAEYLLAEFIVNNLDKDRNCVNFLFEEVLGGNGLTIEKPDVENDACNHQIKHPVFVNFIEMHMKRRAQSLSFKELLPTFSRLIWKETFKDQDISKAVVACVCNNLEYTFEYAAMIYDEYVIPSKAHLKLKYFKYLPHVAIWKSENVSMLEKVLNFTSEQLNADLSFYDVQEHKCGDCIIANYTLLHAVAYRGNYNMAIYLVEKYNDKVSDIENLLDVLVYNSADNPTSVIEEKLLILDMLVNINCGWIEKKEEGQITPLLQNNIHFKLLRRLVELGADINAYSNVHGTVLHRTSHEYNQVVQWAFSEGFKLFNSTDNLGRTPIMHAIKKFGSVDNEVLELFREKGAVLIVNSQDKNGDSILFLSLDRINNLDFISKLLELDADMYHRNIKNQNVMHKVVQGWKGSIQDRLEILDRFFNINPGWIHEKDTHDCTPLLQKSNDFALAKRLVQLGADINAYSTVYGTVLHTTSDKDNYKELLKWALSNGFTRANDTDENKVTPLMHAIKICGTVDHEVLVMLLDKGVDINAQDSNGDTALFYSLRYADSVDSVAKLHEFKADIHHKNKINQTAAHMVMQWGQDSNRILDTFEILEKNGFNSKEFRQKDSIGRTPLHIGQSRRIVNPTIRQYLRRQVPIGIFYIFGVIPAICLIIGSALYFSIGFILDRSWLNATKALISFLPLFAGILIRSLKDCLFRARYFCRKRIFRQGAR